MKRKYFVLILFFMLLIPFKVNALDIFSYSVNDNKIEFKSNDLEFKNIRLVDNSNSSSLSFGLTGNVVNNNDSSKTYETNVTFYDRSNIVLAKSKVTQIARTGESIFNHTLNISELKGRRVNEIYYFTIGINTTYKEETYSMTPSLMSQYKQKDYVIDSYNVIIKVNEDNSFDIEEDIEAFFNTKMHGLTRTIPVKNNVTRLDGTVYNNRAKITDIYVSEKYSKSNNDDKIYLKIGNTNTMVSGKVSYVIKYKYHLYDDKNSKYDELYFNIIGNEWNTVIGNVTFTIMMPKGFDTTKLGFSKGIKGSTNNYGITYKVNGNTITGKYNGILGVGEGITIRCELPDGYFVIPTGVNWSLIVPIICLILSAIIWYLFGRNPFVVDTIEFYPPDGLNSLEIGRLYNGKANKKDVISLLIYFASKGYIKIVEYKDEKIISKQTNFKIYNLRDYAGYDENERSFLQNLFFYSEGKEELDGNSYYYITTSSLKYNFYQTIDKIMYYVNTKVNIEKIMLPNIKIKIILAFLLLIAGIFTFIYPVYRETGITGVLYLSIGLIYVPFYAAGIFGNMKLRTRILLLGFTLLHNSFMFIGKNYLSESLNYSELIPTIIIGIVCIIGIAILISKTKKRTEYGAQMLGRIKGFKKFLVTAEKEKLEAMVMENPTYFYDILPYTYVLGVSDKWINKFEDIAIPEPNWYQGNDAFTMHNFNNSFNSLMNTTSHAMTLSPRGSSLSRGSSSRSSSSGSSWGGSSGSSGGGSSGGGSGGGGGSSW